MTSDKQMTGQHPFNNKWPGGATTWAPFDLPPYAKKQAGDPLSGSTLVSGKSDIVTPERTAPWYRSTGADSAVRSRPVGNGIAESADDYGDDYGLRMLTHRQRHRITVRERPIVPSVSSPVSWSEMAEMLVCPEMCG